MLPEIPQEELADALDRTVEELLARVGCKKPPFDAQAIAKQLGIVVANDSRMTGRARLVKLAGRYGQMLTTIFVGKHERPERLHWSIAHELGESASSQVFQTLGVQASEIATGTREKIANLLATRLLLPKPYFSQLGEESHWELLDLKEAFSTASHELIARRMLDMSPSVIVSLWDQGTLQWRQSNCGPSQEITPVEKQVQESSHKLNETQTVEAGLPEGMVRLTCWPIHELGWRREILRTEICADW